MIDSSQLTSLVIISSRRTELFDGLKKILSGKKIPINDKILENAINRIENKFFLTQSEIQNNRISIHNGIKHIVEENPTLIQDVFDNYLKDIESHAVE